MSDDAKESMLDLLCKQALNGLTAEEAAQLKKLESEIDLDVDAASLEETAARLAFAGVDAHDEMPANLQAKILKAADAHFAWQHDDDATSAAMPIAAPKPPVRVGGFFQWLGWAAAAAACAALAVNIYLTRFQTVPAPTAKVETPATPMPAAREQLTPAQQRDQLISADGDLARASWSPGTLSGVKPVGDVVWSDTQQTGYIRLTGLPKNDPSQETYQLWIVAGNQDPKTPVDAGTFNVTADGEVIVPLDPRVTVAGPKAFAITVEKPGGVVVSKLKKVAATAKVET